MIGTQMNAGFQDGINSNPPESPFFKGGNIDEPVKSRIPLKFVIPAEAGIQLFK